MENTSVTTLDIRNFRALVIMANYFNIELRQYHIPTAFLNAKLNQKLYVETPNGIYNVREEIVDVLLFMD